MIEILKQLTLSVFGIVLGLAVLATNANPAMADRNKVRWVEGSPRYANEAQAVKRQPATTKRRTAKQKFDPKLDFETEAVWRNMRPEWFDD